MMKVAYENGFTYEGDYKCCTQCVIAVIQDTISFRNDYIHKAGNGLAGGAGECTDGNCGDYTSGVMMISFLLEEQEKKKDPKMVLSKVI
jgi:hypothetical protein